MRIVVAFLVKCAFAERNEAVKTAMKMGSATKTLVDNLITELAQLRRENAEMIMATESLENEIKRLKSSEEATSKVGEVQKNMQLEDESMEVSDSSEQKTNGCPTWTKLSCTTKQLWSAAQNQAHLNVNTKVCTVASTETCDRYTMHDMYHSGTSTSYKNAECCALSNKKSASTYSKDVYFSNGPPYALKGDTVTGFWNENPCAQNKADVSGSADCNSWDNR